MEVAERYQDQLDRIKKNVKQSYDYFKPNYDRYNEFKRFIFETSLSEEEITLLSTLSKPQLEFNILEAYISRLLGEFSKQEPDIEVTADDENLADPMTIKVVDQHLRHTLNDARNSHTRYEVYKDVLSGGFSTLKITTKYPKPMSTNQIIDIERAYDPTLCGFDQYARMPHKGDGRFAFENFPMSKDTFEEEYPDINISGLAFVRSFSGFNWSYLNDNGPILIVCDYYEKKRRKTKVVTIPDEDKLKTIKYDEYKKMLDEWSEFKAPPAIVGKPRYVMLETICRYRLIENQVLEYEETDFTMLPLIFVDGNSAIIKTPKNANVRQVTRPYVYHAKSAQRLKNFAGISLANEVENIIQHKFIIKKEALPKEAEFLEAIKDIQKPSNIVVNAFYEEDPNMPIPEPIREITKIPAPPEVVQSFSTTDSLIQNILGSYDASLGINDNQLSGIAIVEAASQSNAAAMPYIVGYLQGYQRAAEIYVDLMPKYYTTPMSLPILDSDGNRSSIKINQKSGMNMFFDANALNVVVKAGASFRVQNARTIDMIRSVSQMSPIFAQFMGEKGLPFILDHMEGKGIEQLKQLVDEWLQEYGKEKQMMMQEKQQQMQNNPMAIKAQFEKQKLQQDMIKSSQQFQLDLAKLKQDQEKVLQDAMQARDQTAVQLIKAQTEKFSKEVELTLKGHDQVHRHKMDIHNAYQNMSEM